MEPNVLPDLLRGTVRKAVDSVIQPHHGERSGQQFRAILYMLNLRHTTLDRARFFSIQKLAARTSHGFGGLVGRSSMPPYHDHLAAHLLSLSHCTITRKGPQIRRPRKTELPRQRRRRYQDPYEGVGAFRRSTGSIYQDRRLTMIGALTKCSRSTIDRLRMRRQVDDGKMMHKARGSLGFSSPPPGDEDIFFTDGSLVRDCHEIRIEPYGIVDI
jgi:hypothetical protein